MAGKLSMVVVSVAACNESSVQLEAEGLYAFCSPLFTIPHTLTQPLNGQVPMLVDGRHEVEPLDSAAVGRFPASFRYEDAQGWDILIHLEPERVREDGLDAQSSLSAERQGTLKRCSPYQCEASTVRLLPLLAESVPSRQQDEKRALVQVSSAKLPQANNSKLAAGSTAAFLARGDQGLAIIDLTQEGRGEVLAKHSAQPGESFNDVELFAERWLLIASNQRGLRILDVSDPPSPVVVADAAPYNGATVHNLTVEDDVVFLSSIGDWGGLSAISLKDPSRPILLWEQRYEQCEQVHDAAVSKDHMMLSCLDQGFLLLEKQQDGAPLPLAHYALNEEDSCALGHSAAALSEGRWLITTEGYAGTIHGLQYDPDSNSLELKSTFSLGGAASPHDLLCNDSICWVAYYQEGLIALDYSTPQEPMLLGRWKSWSPPSQGFLEGAAGLSRSQQTLYVGDTKNGLLQLPGNDL